MLKDLFKTKPKYITVKTEREVVNRDEPVEKKEIPDGLWIKCGRCPQITYIKDLEKNLKVCPKCGFHFRISAKERLKLLIDKDSFKEINANLKTVNILNFPDYESKIKKSQKATELTEGIITGEATIDGIPVVLAIIDFAFIGGSMGSVVGEKLTRAIEYSIEKKLAFVSVSAGGGGARMHEGIFSLMQMAKTSQALNRLAEAGCLYISVLTDPTMGGVFASFASLGDIMIAEPDALIGFAGPRVIQQTIKQTLPEGFQTSQFLLEHGFLDLIVNRKDLKQTISQLVKFHLNGGGMNGQ
ncbi:MAG TPA: acetyl-CoA carboxylase, carboxyltransferase subunit beta [Bacillota bacterium]|nr:acetyl-CoA carboxylase, carboxyltransferase subunit beta [Bacillota bacterium]HOL10383.1 acetyl-CoA carboxylase, carboxyltransferase subunit beta [Bacillota bacterium]HPO97436.1 acetyl-CoA carboxylase, carboxyltransferase subunit beta [Bacillota bacterium]